MVREHPNFAHIHAQSTAWTRHNHALSSNSTISSHPQIRLPDLIPMFLSQLISAARVSFPPSLIASLCLLGTGCASQQAQHESLSGTIASEHIVVQHTQVHHKITQTSASNPLLSELLILIGSFENTEHTTTTDQSPAGPQLIAGDWLAWQCAIAGGYLKSSEHQKKSAPTFAEAAVFFID